MDNGGLSLKISRTGTDVRATDWAGASALTVDAAVLDGGSKAVATLAAASDVQGAGVSGADRGKKSRAIMSESFF